MGQLSGEVLGIKIGKSTKSDLLEAIKDQDFEIKVDEERNQIAISGEFDWEGITVDVATFSIYNDTIWMGVFVKDLSVEGSNNNQLSKLQSKYTNQQELRDEDIFITGVFALSMGINTDDFWGKQDGELSIIAHENPNFLIGACYHYGLGNRSMREMATKMSEGPQATNEEGPVYGEVLGLQVGKAVREDLIRVLKDSNMTVTTEDDVSLSFYGNFTWEGRPMQVGTFMFKEDTICGMFCVSDTIPQADSIFMDLLDVKYRHMPDIYDGVVYEHIIKIFLSDSKRIISKSGDISFYAGIGTDRFYGGYYDGSMLIRKFSTISNPQDYDEANAVTSVAGCRFGTEANATKNFFDRKFKESYIFDDYCAKYSDVYFIGILFDNMNVHFKYNKETNQREFCAIDFQKYYQTWDYDAAKSRFDAIRNIFSNKYTNERYMDSDDSKDIICYYGMIDKNYDDAILPIRLSLEKSYSKGGDLYYYVVVSYYIFNTLNQYDDEI